MKIIENLLSEDLRKLFVSHPYGENEDTLRFARSLITEEFPYAAIVSITNRQCHRTHIALADMREPLELTHKLALAKEQTSPQLLSDLISVEHVPHNAQIEPLIYQCYLSACVNHIHKLKLIERFQHAFAQFKESI